MQGRISIIQNGKWKMGRAFLRANQELDFSVGVYINSKPLPTPISDSSMKGLDPCLEAVARAGGVKNGPSYRLQHLLGWSQIRRADGEVDQSWSALL